MNNQMKNVLITGGAGFIGSNFIRFLTRNASKSEFNKFGFIDLRWPFGEFS